MFAGGGRNENGCDGIAPQRVNHRAPTDPIDAIFDGATFDPVCGKTVKPTQASMKVTRNGMIAYFCSEHCLMKFEAKPASYTLPLAQCELSII